jgi:hypothetical protein
MAATGLKTIRLQTRKKTKKRTRGMQVKGGGKGGGLGGKRLVLGCCEENGEESPGAKGRASYYI